MYFAQAWMFASTLAYIATYDTTCSDRNWELRKTSTRSIKSERLRTNMFLNRVTHDQRDNEQFIMFTTKASCRGLHQECLLWNPQVFFCGEMEEKDCNLFVRRRCPEECLPLNRALTNLMCRYDCGKLMVGSGEANGVLSAIKCVEICNLDSLIRGTLKIEISKVLSY